MPLSPTSTYASYKSTDNPTLHIVSTDPGTESRLGEWGYIDQAGRWRKICNIFDLQSCLAINARPIQLSRPIAEYKTEKQDKPFGDPFVILSTESYWQTMDPEILAT